MADVQAELQMVVIPAQAGIHLSGRETVRAKKVKSYERTQHVIENKSCEFGEPSKSLKIRMLD